jgi:outer membrane protein OmpA-like peptidoglycan-associated protein
MTPEVYETTEKRVLIHPAHKRFEKIPAAFKNVEERILVKPATKKFIYVPAEFQTITEEVTVEDPYNEITIYPPQLGINYDTLQVKPKTGKWEYRVSMENCQSNDPRDCMVLRYVESPPEFRFIPKAVIEKGASFMKKPVTGKKTTITRQVVVKEARVEEVEIPAEYTTIVKRVLVTDETLREVDVPAEYSVEAIQVLKEKGGEAVWEEIDCKLMEYNILPVSFSTGSAWLSADSELMIETTLLKLLQEKKYIHVEIGSHTDARGAAKDNEALSQARADAVLNFLVSKGILAERLVAKGFGESHLTNRCKDGVFCSEAEHAQNRRTEFRVLSN